MMTLVVSPDEDSYQLTVGADALSVNYGGGAAATRRNLWGAPSMIQAQWTLSALGYTYIMAFYRLTGRGTLAFLVDLIVDESDTVTCRAKFVPGSFVLYAKTGDAFVVQSQLEVAPPIYDQTADQAIIDSFVPVY